MLHDTETGYRIAIAAVPYRAHDRLMMVVFEDRGQEIVAITIHPLDQPDVVAKLQSGRSKP